MRFPRYTLWAIMVVVAVVAVAFSGLFYLFRPEYRRLVVVNQSGQSISSLTIAVGGQHVILKALADGSRTTATYRWRRGDEFAIIGTLADGTRVGRKDGGFGYAGDGYPVLHVGRAGELSLGESR